MMIRSDILVKALLESFVNKKFEALNTDDDLDSDDEEGEMLME